MAEEKKKGSQRKNSDSNAKNVPAVPIPRPDDKRRPSATPLPSARVGNDAGRAENSGEISQPPTSRNDEGSSNPVKTKGRKRSKGNEAHVVSNKSAITNEENKDTTSSTNVVSSSNVATGSETTKTGGKKKGGGDKSSSSTGAKKESSGNNYTILDDEASLDSYSSYGAGGGKDDGYPKDRKALVKMIEDKENQLKDQKKNFDVELKKKVKEYLRSHGIGFGANQQ